MKKYVVYYEFYLEAEDIAIAENEALLITDNFEDPRMINPRVTVRETDY